MEWGEHVDTLEGAADAGIETAKKSLSDRPSLGVIEAHVLETFYFLSLSRPSSGFGVGAIPLSEIESYCSTYGIQDRAFFTDIIRTVDSALLSEVRKRAKNDG